MRRVRDTVAVFSHIPAGIPRVAAAAEGLLRVIPFPGAVALLDPPKQGGFSIYPCYRMYCGMQASSLYSMRVAYSDHSTNPVCGFRGAKPVLHGTNSTEPT